MKHIFQLIRYKNLLMLVFMQLIFRYAFLKPQGVFLALADWQFMLLIIATICIAAGGYIINDIMDSATDYINKPDRVIVGKHLSEYNAYNYYIIFNVIGVAIGFYLSNVIDKPAFLALFIFTSGTLYLYATNLKQSLLVGNIIVSLLVALSVLIIGLFDLYPVINADNQAVLRIFFGILLDYAFIVFVINLLREIVKDMEDYEGDKKQGMRTLPIIFGIATTTKILAIVALIPVGAIVYYVLTYLFNLQIASIYILAIVVGPLLYFSIKIWTSRDKNDFRKMSNLLKWIMFFGIISIAVITYNMQ